MCPRVVKVCSLILTVCQLLSALISIAGLPAGCLGCTSSAVQHLDEHFFLPCLQVMRATGTAVQHLER